MLWIHIVSGCKQLKNCVDESLTVFRALMKLVNDKGNNWPDHLDAVLFSLRTKKQQSTRYSPFRLLYHREAKYPVELDDNEEVSFTKTCS
jgi:hypothetical protein